jgi:hypothetical protein
MHSSSTRSEQALREWFALSCQQPRMEQAVWQAAFVLQKLL